MSGLSLEVLVTWTVFQSDVGVVKDMTIVDSTGAVRDLSGLTITLKVYKGGFNNASYIYATITGSQIVAPTPSNGVVKWTVGASDLTNVPPGTYQASIVLTSNGYEEHTKPFTLFVRAAP